MAAGEEEGMKSDGAASENGEENGVAMAKQKNGIWQNRKRKT